MTYAYLVMEFYEGGTLRNTMELGTLDPRTHNEGQCQLMLQQPTMGLS